MGKYKTLWKSLKKTLKVTVEDEDANRILPRRVVGSIFATISTMDEMEKMYDRGDFDEADE